jgi:hypothetical protein
MGAKQTQASCSPSFDAPRIDLALIVIVLMFAVATEVQCIREIVDSRIGITSGERGEIETAFNQLQY